MIPFRNIAYEAEAPMSAWELTSTRLLHHPKTAIIIIIATAFFPLWTVHLCVFWGIVGWFILFPLFKIVFKVEEVPVLPQTPSAVPPIKHHRQFSSWIWRRFYLSRGRYHSHLQRFLILDPSINFRGWSFPWNVTSSGHCGDNWCPVSSVSSMT